MDSSEIEWEKYNKFQQALFWCLLHYRTTGAVLLLIVTIAVVINCRAAFKLYHSEQLEKSEKRERTARRFAQVHHAKSE